MDVLSLGLKSKKLVADAMAVSLLVLQKVRIGVNVGLKLECRRGIVDTVRQDRVVVSRRSCTPRLTPVAMRGALDLAARIMSCEILPNPPITIRIGRTGPQYLASGPSLYCPAYETRWRDLRFVGVDESRLGRAGRTAVRRKQ